MLLMYTAAVYNNSIAIATLRTLHPHSSNSNTQQQGYVAATAAAAATAEEELAATHKIGHHPTNVCGRHADGFWVGMRKMVREMVLAEASSGVAVQRRNRQQ